MPEDRRIRPLVTPLQRTLVRRVLQLLAGLMLLWLGLYMGLNDRRLGALVSKVVTGSVRGTFHLGYVHYDYWSSFASLILNTPAPVRGGDYELRDPDGALVLRVERVEGELYIGQLVRSLLRTAVSAPFKRGVFVDLRFSRGRITGGHADIHPTASSLQTSPDRPEVNIVAAMSSKTPKPDGPGRIRIILEGDGVALEEVQLRMSMGSWLAQLDGVGGVATLRFSSASSETRPGRPAFVFSVMPLRARSGELVLAPPPADLPPDRPNPFAFSLRDIDLRHFRARPSQPQELTFRGRVHVAPIAARTNGPQEALFELRGKLLDSFCDAGVDLEISFRDAGSLLAQISSGMLFGPARGRLHIYGPFSQAQPTLPDGRPHPCLAERRSPYLPSSDERTVIIEGNVADVEAQAAGIHLTEASSQLRLAHGVLLLPLVTAEALGGQVQMEPLRITFGRNLQYWAQVRAQGTDPAQVRSLPPSLRSLLAGRLSGGVRIHGALDTQRGGERIRFANLDVMLAREQARDPWPREVNLRGDVVYSPAQVTLRGMHLEGEGLRLEIPEGYIAPRSGRLRLEDVSLAGGPVASRLIQRLGLPATVEGFAARLRVGGSLHNPVIDRGALAAQGLTIAGRRIDELAAGFSLQDGTFHLQDVQAHGLGGSASASGSLGLFRGSVDNLLSDPPLALQARVDGVTSTELLRSPLVSGSLSGGVQIAGTLLRPTGSTSVVASHLKVLGVPVHDMVLDLELRPGWFLLNSLYAALGHQGLFNGSAQVGREGNMPMHVTLSPHRLQLRDVPGMHLLPYELSGEVTGSLEVHGTVRPLRPVLEGEILLNDFGVRGRPLASLSSPPGEPMEPQALFRLLHVTVRSLTLGHAALHFRPAGEATLISGTLFDTFDLDGRVYLDPLDPHGEVTLRFGCHDGENPGPSARPRDCDFLVQRLLPDLQQLGDVELRTSGSLQLRFGHTPLPGGQLAVQATLRLSRVLLTVKTVDDEGTEQWYRVFNDGEVILTSDGQTHRFQQARFLSERSGGPSADVQSRGEVALWGHVGQADSNLVLRGQLGLELIERLLRSRFRRTRGMARMDVRLHGPIDRPLAEGTVELRNVELVPYDMDTTFHLVSARLVLGPQRAEVRDFALRVDGGLLQGRGEGELVSLAPPRVGRIDLHLDGAVAGRLLQWYFPRNLSDAGGQVAVHRLHIHGTLDAPRLDGSLSLGGLYVNIRRFHELLFQSGTIRLRSHGGGGGEILLGCGPERRPLAGGDCQAVQATVDGDGHVSLSGEILHSGLQSLGRPDWYQALDRVDIGVRLTNVRHSTPGVYHVELTTAVPLQLLGSRERVTLSGKIDVVSGRYTQPFELSERFLARRVVEEEEPFWQGDPFLSSRLILDLGIVTRGNLQVLNNIADLRLSSSDFSLSGPLSDLRMGGVVRVDSGRFSIPGVRGEFTVKGDSKLEFSRDQAWPETPWVDVRGTNVPFDRADEQRNIELALRGKVSELKIECISSDGMNASDCASYLLLGGTAADLRRSLAAGPGAGSSRTLAYSDNAAKLITQELLTRQLADPLRQKLRLDLVRIQFGVSTFDLQLCKRFGLYLRACGLAEWGLLAATAARYRAYGELQLSDYTVGQVSFDRLERGFDLLQDTINRFKLQVGLRLPFRF
ncbi:MAG: translocation/assembly module TamB [Myxococcota bacterium]|nr:translocation/assembly module TamB [Myxococcota bacterium]